jgi:hypothetical protein
VQVKKVNLPDGTAVDVSFDFRPIGRITLSRTEGTLTADLGHFAVFNDEVRISYAGRVILIGPFFKSARRRAGDRSPLGSAPTA